MSTAAEHQNKRIKRTEDMSNVVKAFACHKYKEKLVEFEYPAVDLEKFPHFIDIDITHSGCCHSDLHSVRGEWKGVNLPCVPGHEIVGKVRAVGKNVKQFKVGDRVAVGTIVDSCGNCRECDRGEEQHCNDCVYTYGTYVDELGRITYGGYAKRIQVNERFAYYVPEGIDSAGAAPLLCAGVTTFSPLVTYGVRSGHRVAVVGLGGLGHLGVQFAVAMGCEVAVISHSSDKEQLAKKLGAKIFINTKQEGALAKYNGHFDFILHTVSANIDLNPLFKTLRTDGKFCTVALPENSVVNVDVRMLINNRISFGGSLVAGRVITKQMLEFCALHNIKAMVETLPMNEENVNLALERVEKNIPRFRTVLTNE